MLAGLTLKYFYHKTLIKINDVFEQNYRFFNDDEFKNDLIDIPWDNIISPDNISVKFDFRIGLCKNQSTVR